VVLQTFKMFADDQTKVYFSINDIVPPKNLNPSSDIITVNSVGILWDASSSRKDIPRRNKEFDVIRVLCNTIKIKKIDVYIFRNTLDEQETFTINNGDSSPIINFLSQTS